MAEAFVGLMSGTSLDGVDAVLALAGDDGALQDAGHVHRPFDPALRSELLALNRSGADELHRAALSTNALMRHYAEAVRALQAAAGRSAADVRAIGAHSQTVRHRPGEFDGTGYTLQLMNGALLAELTGIPVACDFRSRDVAAGGQGAPLVPAFHAARFGRAGQAQAVLNVGGIANITLLDGAGGIRGFDCGPGNVLMDAWTQQYQGRPFDADGAWAAQGLVHPGLLAALLSEPFLAVPPPKSTGRDLFTPDWLQPRLAAVGGPLGAADVMATLAEFTATAAVQALRLQAPGSTQLVVCGGGAFNAHLMQRLAALSGLPVVSSATLGVAPDQVEALAFAWLARARVRGEAGNEPAVTGAAGPRVLGALYPA
ncbi:MAG: anhydro-N-acetylmuramic acid kinase [Rubrivivax sp.]